VEFIGAGIGHQHKAWIGEEGVEETEEEEGATNSTELSSSIIRYQYNETTHHFQRNQKDYY
jgi:hypothetical protein